MSSALSDLLLDRMAVLVTEGRAQAAPPVDAGSAGCAEEQITIEEGVTVALVAAVMVWGLTETYGPITLCPEQEAWRELPAEQRARHLAHQGPGIPFGGSGAGRQPGDDRHPAGRHHNGRGGHARQQRDERLLQDEAATATAFAGGGFHSGNLAV